MSSLYKPTHLEFFSWKIVFYTLNSDDRIESVVPSQQSYDVFNQVCFDWELPKEKNVFSGSREILIFEIHSLWFVSVCNGSTKQDINIGIA
mgnify:CR=1 FL=1